MKPIETTATFEGPGYLRLAHPLDKVAEGEVRVIVFFEKKTTPAAGNFRAAIGSFYRDFPEEPIRGSDIWLEELREGEKI